MSQQPGEQERHQWLEAIGIESWLPRHPLPGAAAPADWVQGFTYPAPESEPAHESSAAPESRAPAASAPVPHRSGQPSTRAGGSGIDTQSLLGETAARPKPAVAAGQQAEPSAPVAERQAVEPAPHFKLAYLVRGDLLIIDSLPPHHREGFGRQHKRLLQGITTALGLSAQQELSDAAMLPWPMLASKTLDQGPGEARLAVEHKLKRTLEFQPDIQRILLLGDAAVQWVTGKPLEQGAQPPLLERACAASVSLSELLRLPERKAELWQDVQSLRRDTRAN